MPSLSNTAATIATVAIVAIAATVAVLPADAQPMSPWGCGAYNIGCYPYGYGCGSYDPYCYNGYYGGYGCYPWFSANDNRFNANNNAVNANAVTSAFSSHQNQADHIANSDVNAFTTASNLNANNNCVSNANHNVIG
ncbi:hypothetical protein BDF22DRAFT_651968 [Syncephalis plumigaleata]|nr:hypothetical protein BDF22DRAFT_651963 [Syncephalis plumigaleata]KAI8057814.1 hypothetical protein BDF22DRAFT_651968 [Syncephalis plumigaleata]